MKEYIKKLQNEVRVDSSGKDAICSPPTISEVTEKINEIIDYLNMVISVGMLPYPEGYNWREEEG